MPVRLPPSRKNRTRRAPGVRPIRKRATPPGADRLRAECWASEFALRERRNIQLRKIHRIRPPRQRHPKLLHPREQEVVQGKPKPETLIAPETIHEANSTGRRICAHRPRAYRLPGRVWHQGEQVNMQVDEFAGEMAVTGYQRIESTNQRTELDCGSDLDG